MSLAGSGAELCEKLLEHAVWINLHTQSGGLELMELRVPEGYGARWAILHQDPQGCQEGEWGALTELRGVGGVGSAEAGGASVEEPSAASGLSAMLSEGFFRRYEFRGFLEPHMSDGWEKGWRH